MLSGAVRNNHEDKTELALHGVSLKHHEFVVLEQNLGPAYKPTPLPAAVLHCFLLQFSGTMFFFFFKVEQIKLKSEKVSSSLEDRYLS